MEIWGVQIPIDYVVVGGAVVIAGLTILAARILRRYIIYRIAKFLQSQNAGLERDNAALPRLLKQGQSPAGAASVAGAIADIFDRAAKYERTLKTIGPSVTRSIRLLNFVTTVLALVPLIGAIVALLSEHSDTAIRLDVVGLVTLIVTKGSLWLLLSLPAWIGSGITGFYVQRALERMHKKREPAKKK